MYEGGSNAFARFMFEELFGHEYNTNSVVSRYPVTSVSNIYLKADYGDLIEFTKGSDTYSVILKSADKNGMNVYEAYSAPNGDVVFEGYYSYDKNHKDDFMDGRFKGGTLLFTTAIIMKHLTIYTAITETATAPAEYTGANPLYRQMTKCTFFTAKHRFTKCRIPALK